VFNGWSLRFAVLSIAAGFLLGHWFGSTKVVRADSAAAAQVEVRDINGNSSLILSYPSLKTIYVYQTPFVGLPTWSCAYWFQLGDPGAPITRQPCKR
jgi:hypothetical protein